MQMWWKIGIDKLNNTYNKYRIKIDNNRMIDYNKSMKVINKKYKE